MKRALFVLVTSALLLSICSCATKDSESNIETVSETAAAQETDPGAVSETADEILPSEPQELTVEEKDILAVYFKTFMDSEDYVTIGSSICYNKDTLLGIVPKTEDGAYAFDGTKLVKDYTGKGVAVRGDGTVYIGELKNSLPEGKGILVYGHYDPTNGLYSWLSTCGSFSEGKANGECVCNEQYAMNMPDNVTEHYTYTGTYKDDRTDGELAAVEDYGDNDSLTYKVYYDNGVFDLEKSGKERELDGRPCVEIPAQGHDSDGDFDSAVVFAGDHFKHFLAYPSLMWIQNGDKYVYEQNTQEDTGDTTSGMYKVICEYDDTQGDSMALVKNLIADADYDIYADKNVVKYRGDADERVVTKDGGGITVESKYGITNYAKDDAGLYVWHSPDGEHDLTLYDSGKGFVILFGNEGDTSEILEKVSENKKGNDED